MLERLAEAEAMTLDDYRADITRRARIRELFAQLGGLTDGVITLSATGAAPLGLQSTGDPIFAVPGSLLGVPAISLPVLRAENSAAGSAGDGFRTAGRGALLGRGLAARAVRGSRCRGA